MATLNKRAETQTAYRAVVLGGSKGLGRDLIELGMSNGWNILNISRGSAGLGDRIGEIYADLTKPEDVAAICSHLKSIRFDFFFWVAGKTMPMGPFQGLVDAKGKPRRSPEEMASQISDMIAVNIAGAMPIVHTAWQKMRDQSDAALVVVASRSGLQPKANEAVYAATKAFQVQFARSLGLEVYSNPKGPRVLLFNPGGMKSEFWDTNPEVDISQFLDTKDVAAQIMIDLCYRPYDHNAHEVIATFPRYFEREIPRDFFDNDKK